MPHKIVKAAAAPPPIGPYNQAVWAGDLLFVSGQIALHPHTGELLTQDLRLETHRVMQNLQAILAEAGLDFEHVVKATIFLSDMSFFSTVNEIYGSYFTGQAPARETVLVAGLPKNVNVEISVIACR